MMPGLPVDVDRASSGIVGHRRASSGIASRSRAGRASEWPVDLRLLTHRRHELRCTNLPLAAHLVSVAVEALTHAMPELPEGTTPEGWADEVTQLIVRYLLPLDAAVA